MQQKTTKEYCNDIVTGTKLTSVASAMLCVRAVKFVYTTAKRKFSKKDKHAEANG